MRKELNNKAANPVFIVLLMLSMVLVSVISFFGTDYIIALTKSDFSVAPLTKGELVSLAIPFLKSMALILIVALSAYYTSIKMRKLYPKLTHWLLFSFWIIPQSYFVIGPILLRQPFTFRVIYIYQLSCLGIYLVLNVILYFITSRRSNLR